MQEKIIIVDFGSQFTQLIARRVRELNIYCEIYPYNNLPEVTPDVKGVIFSGSPFSVRQEDAPQIDLSKYHLKFPLLAVCYGAQYIAQHSGGAVQPSSTREYGRANLNFVNQENKLFKGINIDSQVWMSHGDTITDIPENFELIASTDSVKVAAYHIKDSDTYAIQFHP